MNNVRTYTYQIMSYCNTHSYKYMIFLYSIAVSKTVMIYFHHFSTFVGSIACFGYVWNGKGELEWVAEVLMIEDLL